MLNEDVQYTLVCIKFCIGCTSIHLHEIELLLCRFSFAIMFRLLLILLLI